MKIPILFAAMAGIFWGTAGFFFRSLSELSSFETAWFRFFFALIFLSVFILIMKYRIKPKNKNFLFLNGLCLAIWIPIYITSINFGAKLGNAAFLLDTGYVFSILFSWTFLHERIENKTLSVLLVSVAGVFLILKPLMLFQN